MVGTGDTKMNKMYSMLQVAPTYYGEKIDTDVFGFFLIFTVKEGLSGGVNMAFC